MAFTYDSGSSLTRRQQYLLYTIGPVWKELGIHRVIRNFNLTTGAYEGPITLNEVDDVVTIGTKANTAGSGIALTATYTGAVNIYSDDGGASLDTPDNVRGLLSRLLLTVDQTGCSVRGVQGQLKLLDGVDVTSGIYTAVQGYIELAGDTSAKTGSTFSCFDASVEIASTKTLTTDSGGEFFGVHVETTGAGSITNNGTCAAIGITKASGAPSWPVGLYVSSCTTGISIGASTYAIDVTGVAGTVGIRLQSQTAQVFQGVVSLDASSASKKAFEVTTDSNANGAYTVTGGYFATTPSTAAQASITIHGVYSEVSSFLNVNALRAVYGYLNCSAARTIANESSALFGDVNVDNATTLSAGRLSAVHAKIRGDSALTGFLDCIYVDAELSVDNGIYMNVETGKTITAGITLAGAGSYTTAIAIAPTTLTTGISVTGAAGYAIDIVTSGVFRMGVQDTGVPLTTTYPFAMEVQCEANSDIAAGLTGSSAGIYARYAIEYDQTEQCNHIAMFGKLRVKQDLADGVHAAVYGYVEISGTTEIGGETTTQTCAGHFAVEAENGLNLSTGHLNGIVVDSSVGATATISGTMSGIRIKKSTDKLAWPTGIAIEASACTTAMSIGTTTTAGISFTGGSAVLINADATAAAASTRGIFIGEDSNSAQHGIPLLGAEWATAQGNALYCDDDGVALVNYTEAFTVRMLTTAAVSSGDVSTTAMHPDLYLNANYTGVGGLSAIWGNTTIASGKTVDTSGGNGDVGGASFGVDIAGTLAANAHACAVSAGASVSGTKTGILTAYRIRHQSGAGSWDGALSIPDTGADNSNGLTQASAAGSTHRHLKVYVGTTLYTIDMVTA